MHAEPLYRKIYLDLQRKILQGEYAEGDLLPSEKELAAQYGVSRITSKQAMNLLAADNLIVRTRGLGSQVKRVGPEIRADEDPSEKIDPVREFKTTRKTIAVIFDSFDFAYGCDLLRGIEWEASRRGLQILFHCTYGSIDYEKKIISQCIDQGVGGMIIMCVQNEIFDEQILKCMINGFPIILVDRSMARIPIPCVCTDNEAAAKELTQILIRKGHSRIAFVSHVYHDTSSIRERISGYRAALSDNGMIVDNSICLMNLRTGTPFELNRTSGGEAEDEDSVRIRTFMEEHPDVTAYFASQYKVGKKIIRAAKKLGREKKMDVVFFDGSEGMIMDRPYFARVIQDEQGIGSKAVQMLDDRMSGDVKEEDTDLRIHIPYKIVFQSNE